jgi:hypothetical protein
VTEFPVLGAANLTSPSLAAGSPLTVKSSTPRSQKRRSQGVPGPTSQPVSSLFGSTMPSRPDRDGYEQRPSWDRL